LTSLLITTLYVIRRQQLLLRRGRIQSEQTVVTGVSAFAIVLIGMAVTWTTLALIGMVAGGLLFDAELISSWTNSSDSEARRGFLWSILRMSLFSASFGLLIGALGASFESQNYFRHVIFVDEEI
jgi:hypothetical protein